MKAARKIFKWTFVAIATMVLLMVIGSIILSSVYEQKIHAYLKNYLDAHLLTEISMGDMKFRLLKGFPSGTLEISDVVIFSGKNFSAADFDEPYADTLLYAQHLYLQFNLIRMLKKEYVLKKIEIARGTLNVLYDKRSRHNLDIWKSSGDTTDYSIALKSLLLKDSKIRVAYLTHSFSLSGYSNRTYFKGDLTNGILTGKLKGNPDLNKMNSKNRVLARNARLNLDLQLVYSKENLTLSDCKFNYNKAAGTLEMMLENQPNKTIDLTIHMPAAGLDEIISVFPPSTYFNPKKYAFSGKGKLYIVVKGSLTNHNHLLVKSGFELTQGVIKNTLTRTSLSDINLTGTVAGTRSDNFRLELDSVFARLGKGTVHGVFSLSNLNTQKFRSHIVADIDLKTCKDFIEIDTLDELSGNLLSDITISGYFKDFSDSTLRPLHMIEQGTFTFQDVAVAFKGIPLTIDRLNGKASWSESVRIDSISLRINETHVLADGTITNLKAYLNHNGMLKANLDLSTDNLNISKYLNKPSNSTSQTGYKSLSIIPRDVSLEARLTANRFIAENFEAEQCYLNLLSQRDSLFVKSFSLHFPDGSIQGQGLISIHSDHTISFSCVARPQKINMQRLFYAFNNFSQTFIVDKNLKGLLDGNVKFYAQWDSTLKLIPASMNVQGDLKISNGELVQFDPMLKLSKYIDVDELRHIRFKTIVNTISIRNRIITIPEMDISSSAFNISVSGTHNFDNYFDYHFRVLLSEVLFNKARKKKKEIDEFLIEDNNSDKAAIPLVFSGTPANNTVKLDKRKVLNPGKRKTGITDPQVQPDPGIFTFDKQEPAATVKPEKTETNSSASDFKVEWEDD